MAEVSDSPARRRLTLENDLTCCVGFTMSSSSCLDAGCPFSGPGNAGPCTASPGTLSDVEIRNVILNGATVTLDPVAAVEIVTWDSNQWVSYDDQQSFQMKIDYANSHCIGGYVYSPPE